MADNTSKSDQSQKGSDSKTTFLTPSSFGLGTPTTRRQKIQSAVLGMIGILGLGFVMIIFYQLSQEHDLFGKLKDGSYARGIITFLVALASIGLCFILVVHALFGDDDEKGEHFRRAREVLALLTGILGTIVGFYFGTSEKSVAELLVADVQATVKAEGLTNKWELISFVSGGTPGYRYSVIYEHLNDKSMTLPANISNRWAASGWVNIKFEATNDLVVNLEVQDKNDRRKTIRKELKATDHKEKK